jgi:hypothetical protein
MSELILVTVLQWASIGGVTRGVISTSGVELQIIRRVFMRNCMIAIKDASQ